MNIRNQSDTIETNRAVVVFAKAAEAGQVKTRLTEVLSETRAAELYECFLEDLAAKLASFRTGADVPTDLVLAHAGPEDHPSFDPFRRNGFQFVQQGPGHLGERMARISKWCFTFGADRLSIVGSDSPTLLKRHLQNSFELLDSHDVVLGPSFDGGYYLIGLSSPRSALFAGIDWSTPQVLEQTLARCRDHDLLCRLLEFWYDVDTYADLYRLRYHLLDYLEGRGDTNAPATARFLQQLEADGLFESIPTHSESH